MSLISICLVNMNITFTGRDLYRFGVILYVVAWVVFTCYLNIYSRRKNQNVHKVAKWYFITVFTRHWGWIAGLVVGLVLTWILPDIYVISQNPERIRKEKQEYANKWSFADTTFTIKETFFIDRYYVPFTYKEKSCAAFTRYLLNETDSTLVLYSTNFFNGQFSKVSDITEFEIIPSGYFQPFDRYITNRFSTPSESSFSYIPKDRKDKSTTELTISLMRDAVYDTERIRERMKDRNYLMDAWMEGDSVNFKKKAIEIELNRLERLQNAKQGAH